MELKHSIEHASNSSVKLTVTVLQSDIAAKYADELKKITKSIQIPGFRKGHVPAHILETKYGKEIQGEVAANLINDSLQEIFEKIEERPIAFSQPELEGRPEIDLQKDFSFTVKYDVMPKIAKVDVSKVSITVPEVKIGDADLEKELQTIQERNSVVMDKKADAKCAKGDVVTIDYHEIDADGKAAKDSERKDFVYTAGEKERVEFDLDADILGMKTGDSKEVKRGGKTIKVTLKALKEKKLPAIDDELAQDVDEKFKTLDDLKKSLTKRMERSASLRLREIKTNAVLAELVKTTPVDLPASLITAEKEYRLQSMAQQFGMKIEQLEKLFLTEGKTKDDLLNDYMGNTEEKIKESLIIQALLHEKNIAVSKEEVEAEYARIAEENDTDVAEIKKHYESNQNDFIESLKERKLFDEIFGAIKITKGKKLNLEELFAYGTESKKAEKSK